MAAPVQLLVDLFQTDEPTLVHTGVKAAGFGWLHAHGLAVPPGFCITTRAYDQVCRHRVRDLVEQLPRDPNAAEQIRVRLENIEFPPDLANTIATAYTGMGVDVPVAVRSSATADLPRTHFAGQLDTYLNVIGVPALLDAIRRCWASLWSDRALAHRIAAGTSNRQVKIAVVVQQMVDAAASGTLFTANPDTGNRGEVVVEAIAGLGEPMSAGAVTPDRFVVRDERIRHRRTGHQPVMVQPKPGGGTETVVQPETRPAVNDRQVLELARIGTQIAHRSSTPQEVEWAIDRNGKIWITQLQPITTLFPLPTEQRPGLRVHLSGNLVQGLHRPITPMGAACLERLLTGILRSTGAVPPTGEQNVLFDADGWLHLDVTGAVHDRLGRLVLTRALSPLDSRSAQLLADLATDPGTGRRTALRLLRGTVRALRATRLPLVLATALWNPDRVRRDALRTVQLLRTQLADNHGRTPREQLAAAQQAFLRITAPRAVRLTAQALPGLLLHQLLPRVLGPAADGVDAELALNGVPHSATTEMIRHLWELALRLQSDPTTEKLFGEHPPGVLAARYLSGKLPATLQDELDLFLARHGHRGIAETDTGQPRWSEDPTYLLGLISDYLHSSSTGFRADEQLTRTSQRGEDEARELLRRLRRRSRLRAAVGRFLLTRFRAVAGLQELPELCVALAAANARRNLRAVGRNLVLLGRINEPDDVFFLDFTEVSRAIAGDDFQALAVHRRERYAQELQRERVPGVLLSDGTEPAAGPCAENAGNQLVGTPASAGTVTGRAKVLREPGVPGWTPGDVLVAPSVDPGWTPLLLLAGGLVLETGGVDSPGAVAARQCGIPAVVGSSAATARIRDGQRITVNGSTGTVLLRPENHGGPSD
ncbi:PEP/pyruvate-binding domain-containing protein [Saccharopolyspora rectivirgula]|nr:PEP/pyruvate-binding domain-containing protein [Saccharopolyspora rectivirgula]